MLVNSAVYKKASRRELMFGNAIRLNGTDVPLFLVGDSAYSRVNG